MSEKLKLLIVAQHLEGGGAEKILNRLILHLKDEVDIRFVSLHPREKALNDILSALGIEYYYIHEERGNTFRFASRLRKLIKEIKPDKILSFMYYQNIVTYIALRGLNIPWFLTERSNHRLYLTGSVKHRIWKWYLGKAYRKATAIIAVSDGSKAAIISDFNVNEKKVFTIYNGLSFDQLDKMKEEPVTEFSFSPDKKYIIAVGNIRRAKNYPLLIESFFKLHSDHEETRLIIFGLGWKETEDEIKRMINRLNLHEVVHLAGYCANPYKYLKYASCYVLSSSWEGFPNSLLEAMYINGHVVSTNCPTGPAEIITHNEDGLLCEVDNSQELAAAMEKMCFDENFRKYVFENSRNKIAQFDEKIMIDKYRKIFLK